LLVVSEVIGCGLKIVREITYDASSGTSNLAHLNSTHIYLFIYYENRTRSTG